MENLTSNYDSISLCFFGDKKPMCIFYLNIINKKARDINELIIKSIEDSYNEKVLNIIKGDSPTFFDVDGKYTFLHFFATIENVGEVEFIIEPIKLYHYVNP